MFQKNLKQYASLLEAIGLVEHFELTFRESTLRTGTLYFLLRRWFWYKFIEV